MKSFTRQAPVFSQKPKPSLKSIHYEIGKEEKWRKNASTGNNNNNTTKKSFTRQAPVLSQKPKPSLKSIHYEIGNEEK
jgi:hypothetical protein